MSNSVQYDSNEDVDNSFLGRLAASIFSKGVSMEAVRVMNWALVLLVVVLFVFWVTGNFNVHLFVMLVLAIGLMLSMTWFISELSSSQVQEQQEQQEQDEQVEKKQQISSGARNNNNNRKSRRERKRKQK
jgi:ER protein Pkr1